MTDVPRLQDDAVPSRPVSTPDRLADVDDPLVQQTAARLTAGLSDPADKLERIFGFVRDDILFGFPPEGDFVKASQTIERGYGQCNTKGILILALCQAANIPARLHFSEISKEIQHGFFRGLFYKLMPTEISHSWLEVELDGRWVEVDTYINDLALHRAAVRALERSGWTTGYSVSQAAGRPSADLVLDATNFSQMGAVVGDHGTWTKPADYLNGPDYLNRPGPIRQLLYRTYISLANDRVRTLRN
jgi:transglutaminase-like putative cysteine protease